jgi:hypothetical protein
MIPVLLAQQDGDTGLKPLYPKANLFGDEQTIAPQDS